MTNPDTLPVGSPPRDRPEAPASASPLANAGLPRFLVVLLGVAVTLLIIVLLRELAGIIAPVFLAVNLVIAAYPIHTWLRSKGTPGWLSATVMFFAVTVLLLLVVAGLVWAVSAMVNQLPAYSGAWTALYNQVMTLLRNVGVNSTGVGDVMQHLSPSSVVGLLSTAFSYTTATAVVVGTIVLSLIFLAMDTPGMRGRLRVGALDFPRLAASMTHFARSVRTYWVATTVFGLIIALFDGVALTIMGVPLAIVWAMLAFLTNYIPNVGLIIGLIPPVLLALLGQGWQMAVAVLIVYLVLSFVILSVIAPRIIGESVGVTPTVSFVSLLLWGYVLGVVGTLVALPMTLLLKALFIDSDPRAGWLGALISPDGGAAKGAVPKAP